MSTKVTSLLFFAYAKAGVSKLASNHVVSLTHQVRLRRQ
jgi:hypothetical protein